VAVHEYGIKVIALLSKADILWSELNFLTIHKRTCGKIRRSFLVSNLRTSSINGFPITRKPIHYFHQDFLLFLRDCAISARGNIEEQTTVFANYIDKLANKVFW
jgi:hypothetical protein